MTIAFDLDDTLFPEIEFVRSAYRAICRHFGTPELAVEMNSAPDPREAFDIAARYLGLHDASQLIKLYREHYPDISLTPAVEETLYTLRNSGITLALITDGRSITQRNKIAALGLERFISPDLIFISEETGADKFSPLPFELVESAADSSPYIYVGDNPAKDFFQPRKRGWDTIMLNDSGQNIHPQQLTRIAAAFGPSRVILSIEELSQMACL